MKTSKRLLAVLLVLTIMLTGLMGTLSAQAANIVYGDVDGDGKIAASDALEVLKSVVGKVTLDEEKNVAPNSTDKPNDSTKLLA